MLGRTRRPMRLWAPLVGLAAALGLTGCDRVPLFCRDTLVSGGASPDGTRVAETFVRDCHYMTGYTVHLTLRSTKDLRRGPGPTAAVFSGARPPALSWGGPRRLVVTPDASSKVLYQTSQWDGVALSYRRPSGDTSSGR